MEYWRVLPHHLSTRSRGVNVKIFVLGFGVLIAVVFGVVIISWGTCLPGYISTGGDGTTEMWVNSSQNYVPGSILEHGFGGNPDYYYGLTEHAIQGLAGYCYTLFSCTPTNYWEENPYYSIYHIRYPAPPPCQTLCFDEYWQYSKTSLRVSVDGGNYDFDCDGLPDIADGDLATPNDKNLGKPPCQSSAADPTNVAMGNM